MIEDHAYISLENPPAADRFVLDIFAKVHSFAELCLTGVEREFGTGIRSFAYRERIIFFRISETELTVLRVLHSHQNVSPDDFTTSET
ncbi:type II toxin-antitoxin system RelE/ParE family toxin [Neorhizobium galegae]|uniref:type II toxin-antitoxin system RelE/ParE family toxin n=1 Tax=Neorhizobium galegae TaxID=399 RepID=UPI001F42494B|nr:type II toxin-antitoxin system RelE/ParE family toxin [Neorhizobium galegae]UIK06743.1 type II toxin-antitoxin system RelE/ParE family toxin [Neorhizobium galegae]